MKSSQLVMAILAVSLASHAFADAPAGDAARGKALYDAKLCYACHGTVGQGGDRGSGPRIVPNPFPWDAFKNQVRRPQESMPRYDAKYLSDAELADIYAYVVSIKAGAKAGEIPLLKD